MKWPEFQNQTVIEPEDKFLYAGRFAPGLAYGEKVRSIKKFNWPGYEIEEIQSREAQRDIAEQSEIFLDNDDDLEMDFIEPPKGHWDPHDTREPPTGQNKKEKSKGSNIAFENFFK